MDRNIPKWRTLWKALNIAEKQLRNDAETQAQLGHGERSRKGFFLADHMLTLRREIEAELIDMGDRTMAARARADENGFNL